MRLMNRMGMTAIAETVATNRVVELSSEEVSMIAGGDGDTQVAVTGEETDATVDSCVTEGEKLTCLFGLYNAWQDMNAANANPASRYDYQNGSDIMDNNYHNGGSGGPGGFSGLGEADLPIDSGGGGNYFGSHDAVAAY